jgi:hypothetical protein
MAALMVPENLTEIVQRPDAPYDLSDEQADEWRAVVDAMPAGHFMRGNCGQRLPSTLRGNEGFRGSQNDRLLRLGTARNLGATSEDSDCERSLLIANGSVSARVP